MFKKLRVAPINSRDGVDGYPVYGSFVKLQTGDFNSVEITINPVTKERTLQADDKEKVSTKILRYTGKLKIFEVDVDAAVALFGFTKDANSNLIQVENNTAKKNFGVFFQSETPNAKKYQKYLYDVEFKTPTFSASTDSGDGVNDMEIDFVVYLVTASSKEVAGATVYEGNTGYIADSAEPVTMYKEVSN